MVLRQCLAHVVKLSDADNRNLATAMASIQRAGSTAQVSTFEHSGEKVKLSSSVFVRRRLDWARLLISGMRFRWFCAQADQSLLILKQREGAKVHAPSSRTKSRLPFHPHSVVTCETMR